MVHSSIGGSTGSEQLLAQFQAGRDQALERLWARYLPRLKRWARGRLRPSSRQMVDTDDLVQDAFVRSIARLRTLELRGPNTLFAYFKKIVLNEVRDLARQVSSRPARTGLDMDRYVDANPSPLERAVGVELLERYQRSLARLSESDQEIVVAAVELRLIDREIAELFEKPTVDAARLARGRAIARLGRAMEQDASKREPER